MAGWEDTHGSIIDSRQGTVSEVLNRLEFGFAPVERRFVRNLTLFRELCMTLTEDEFFANKSNPIWPLTHYKDTNNPVAPRDPQFSPDMLLWDLSEFFMWVFVPDLLNVVHYHKENVYALRGYENINGVIVLHRLFFGNLKVHYVPCPILEDPYAELPDPQDSEQWTNLAVFSSAPHTLQNRQNLYTYWQRIIDETQQQIDTNNFVFASKDPKTIIVS